MANTHEPSPDQALDHLIKTAVDQVNSGSVTLPDLLRTLSPVPPALPAPAAPPLPVAITPEQSEALDRLVDVFGGVVPTERRMLEEKEVGSIIEERMTLDEIADLVEKRKESIRTTVCNHLDVEAETEGQVGPDTVRDRHGHYVLPGRVGVPDEPKQFKREIRTNSPSLDADALKTLVDSGDLDHTDYLSMTTQTRVVDENKVMLALKRKPELVRAIARATRPGGKVASLYLRKNDDV